MTLALHDIHKSFANGRVPVLRGLDLSVDSGEILVLAGQSGCGKTTALRLIAGLEVPDRGRIVVGTRPVVSERDWVPPEERSIGLVFQHHALFPHLTVRRNIAFGLRGLSRREWNYRTDELLDLVGIRQEADRFPDEISGGQKQRVAVARALAPKPAVVLLDEPFNNLDPATKRQLMDDVKRVLGDSAAILVTHDSDEAVRMGDRVAYLADGRAVQTGTVEELYLEPSRLEIAEYLGPVNRIPGVRSGDRIETPVGSFVPRNRDGGVKEQGWVLFRPEHLSLCPLASEDRPAKAFGYCDEFGGSSCCLRGTVTESKVCGDYRRIVVSLTCAGPSATPRDSHLMIVHSRLEERYQIGDRVMIAAPLSRMGWAEG